MTSISRLQWSQTDLRVANGFQWSRINLVWFVISRFQDSKISRSHYWRRFGSVISRFINRLQQGQLMWPQWHWNNKIIHIFKLKLSFSYAVKCVTSFGLCDHVICISIRVSLSFHVRVLSILVSQLFNIVTYPSWWIGKSLKGLNCRKIWRDAKWQNQFLCSVISNNTC